MPFQLLFKSVSTKRFMCNVSNAIDLSLSHDIIGRVKNFYLVIFSFTSALSSP